MSDLVEVAGQHYRIGKIDARKQFHVARRLAPLLAGLSGTSGKRDGLAGLIGPIAEALSHMSDEDVDYVLDICLGVCHRQQPNGQFAPVSNRSGLMFQDIDMAAMIQLTVKVIQENMGGFFPGAAATSPLTA